MTIDAAEIARLREEAAFAKNHIMLALLDELEKARAERDAARALLRNWVSGDFDGQFGNAAFYDAARKLLGMPEIESDA